MIFFSDLDRLTWALSIVALAVSATVIAVDIRDWRAKFPIRSRGKRVLLWGFAAVCSIVGLDTIDSASDAPHLYCSGSPSVVRVRTGRSGDTWLVRVRNAGSTEAPLLSLHDARAIVAFREHRRDATISFGYLNEPYFNQSGAAEFKVVDMADGDTGEPFYHFDTRSHPYRVAALFASAILLFLTELLNNRLSDLLPDTEDDYENYRDSRNSKATVSDLTSLNLDDSNDQNRSQT